MSNRCTLSPLGVAWSGAVWSLVPVCIPWGGPCAVVGPWVFLVFRRLDQIQRWGGRLVGGGGLIWCVERLPEQRESSPVVPLRSLHTDFVCRHPWPLETRVCGPHQSDGNPNLDVSTRLRVGLLPLWCEATGYHFQGICRLHPEKSINRGYEEWEVSVLTSLYFKVTI